jgi:hypothetical protein
MIMEPLRAFCRGRYIGLVVAQIYQRDSKEPVALEDVF